MAKEAPNVGSLDQEQAHRGTEVDIDDTKVLHVA